MFRCIQSLPWCRYKNLSVFSLNSWFCIAFGVCYWYWVTWGPELCQLQPLGGMKEKQTNIGLTICLPKSTVWSIIVAHYLYCICLHPSLLILIKDSNHFGGYCSSCVFSVRGSCWSYTADGGVHWISPHQNGMPRSRRGNAREIVKKRVEDSIVFCGG